MMEGLLCGMGVARTNRRMKKGLIVWINERKERK